jgi:para-nitrobenzyl esterase
LRTPLSRGVTGGRRCAGGPPERSTPWTPRPRARHGDDASGALRGTREHGVAAFLGIPYALAPVGERRFGAPVPVPAWSGVRDATTPGATAPMPGYPPPFDRLLPNPVVPGEDHLNLSVGTPDVDARGLPVLVWTHGGAFVNGSNAVPTWDPAPSVS